MVVLEEYEEMKIFSEIEFLFKMKVFSNWSYPSLKTLYLNSIFRKFTLKSVVYKEGDLSDKIFIIKHGEFKVNFPFHEIAYIYI